MKRYQLSELILDFDLYPRGGVDPAHVTQIAEALVAGASVPPIIIDKISKRIVDGFHRWKAFWRLFGEKYEVECVEKSYKNEGEMFLDAMRYNASHGRVLTPHDKAHCLLLGDRLNISADLVAESLNLTPERLGKLRSDRIGKFGSQDIALKQTIRHMAGKKLNKKQAGVNEKLSGMNAVFYVNQLIMLLDSELIDQSNEKLVSKLFELSDLLDGHLRKKAA